MDLNIAFILEVLLVSLVIAIITRYTAQGIKKAFKYTKKGSIVPHIVVIVVDIITTAWLTYFQMHLQWYDILFIFMVSLSGAELIHKMINDIKGLKEEKKEQQ